MQCVFPTRCVRSAFLVGREAGAREDDVAAPIEREPRRGGGRFQGGRTKVGGVKPGRRNDVISRSFLLCVSRPFLRCVDRSDKRQIASWQPQS